LTVTSTKGTFFAKRPPNTHVTEGEKRFWESGAEVT